MPIGVLLIDEMALFRQGIRALVSAVPDFRVLGDCGTGKDALDMVGRLMPGLVILDATLPNLSGIDVTAQVKRRYPQVRVIVLTEHKTSDYVREALRSGADAYLLKHTSFEELLGAMRCVMQGKKFLSPDVSAFVVNSFLNPEATETQPYGLERLTSRERSVMQLIAEGRTNRKVAEFLNLSSKTVEKHRASVMHKLGLQTSAELVLVAMELGMIERPLAVSRLMIESKSHTSKAPAELRPKDSALALECTCCDTPPMRSVPA